MAEPIDKNSQVTSITDAEKDIANAGPAIFTNRFIGAFGPWGVRITFAELGLNGNGAFRAAVVMTMDDAKSLRNMLQDLEEQQKAIQAEKDGQVTNNG